MHCLLKFPLCIFVALLSYSYLGLVFINCQLTFAVLLWQFYLGLVLIIAVSFGVLLLQFYLGLILTNVKFGVLLLQSYLGLVSTIRRVLLFYALYVRLLQEQYSQWSPTLIN